MTARDYPYGISERGKKAFDDLQQAVAAKKIYNPDLEQIKRQLQADIEDLFSSLKSSPISRLLYYIDATPNGFQELSKAVRLLTKATASSTPDFQYAPAQEEMANILSNWDELRRALIVRADQIKTWLPVKSLYEEAKQYVVKGRKPSETPPKVYRPPQVSDTAVLGLVVRALEEVVRDSKVRVTDYISRRYFKLAQDWQSSSEPKKADRLHLRKWLSGMGALHLYNALFESNKEDFGETLRLRSDCEARVAELAAKDVEDMASNYIAKNLRKIASLIAAKGEPSRTESKGELTGWGFNGTIRFDFVDGTGFTVRNSAVMKWSPRGQPFYQFPTTFHDVTFSDGKTRAMVSEEEMNKEWAKSVKMASRRMVAEIPEPPPQMMRAIAEWALGQVAANNALFFKRETELYTKLFAEDGDSHSREMLDKSRASLRESLMMAKRYGAPLTAWRQISKRFKINLGGWRYESLVRDASNRDEANAKFDNLLVVLNDQHLRDSWFDSSKNRMTVFTYLKRADSIEDTIEHELLHWAQHYVQLALKGDWGLPSERSPDIRQWVKQKGSHSLDDAEFYTELLSLIRRINRLSKVTGNDIESVANSMLGIGNPLPDAKPPKFILEIKEMAPKKWELAVKEVFDNIRSPARAASKTASLKTFREIRDEQDPDGTRHDLRMVCDVCGNVETCRCSKPKREFHGICYDCAEKQRLAYRGKLAMAAAFRENQRWDTDDFPKRLTPTWDMPTLGDEYVSEVSTMTRSVNPQERGRHLMMARKILGVAKSLVVAERPVWTDPAFADSLKIPPGLKRYNGQYRGMPVWVLQGKGKLYKDQYGWISYSWSVNPIISGSEWVVRSTLSFAPATSGSFARQKFDQFKDEVRISGSPDASLFGATAMFLEEKDGDRIGAMIAEHEQDLQSAKKFWKRQKLAVSLLPNDVTEKVQGDEYPQEYLSPSPGAMGSVRPGDDIMLTGSCRRALKDKANYRYDPGHRRKPGPGWEPTEAGWTKPRPTQLPRQIASELLKVAGELLAHG